MAKLNLLLTKPNILLMNNSFYIIKNLFDLPCLQLRYYEGDYILIKLINKLQMKSIKQKSVPQINLLTSAAFKIILAISSIERVIQFNEISKRV